MTHYLHCFFLLVSHEYNSSPTSSLQYFHSATSQAFVGVQHLIIISLSQRMPKTSIFKTRVGTELLMGKVVKLSNIGIDRVPCAQVSSQCFFSWTVEDADFLAHMNSKSGFRRWSFCFRSDAVWMSLIYIWRSTSHVHLNSGHWISKISL